MPRRRAQNGRRPYDYHCEMPMSLPTVPEMLAQLVAEPSVSCSNKTFDHGNRGVTALLANWLEDLGFACEVVGIPDQPHKANLIATLGSGPGGIVLAGHTDTVPCNAQLWQRDPLQMHERDGQLYGLGICDMKGFFPLALTAAQAFRGAALRAPITLLATADEESTMAGARQLVALDRPKARYAVIGEPTDMRPIYAHKGMMMLSIRLRGRSGHSSNPGLGVNALDAMHAVMAALMTLRAELAARHCHAAFEVAIPTMNLGCLHGGDSPNRICAEAELQLDLRLVPGMNTVEVAGQLRDRVLAAAASAGVEATIDDIFPPLDPFATAADSRFVRLCEQLTGHPAGTVSFGTEGPYLQALGMETIVLGPGSIDQAHQPDEFLRLDRLQPTIEVLRQLIAACCTGRTDLAA